jgi:hypothetical protein
MECSIRYSCPAMLRQCRSSVPAHRLRPPFGSAISPFRCLFKPSAPSLPMHIEFHCCSSGRRRSQGSVRRSSFRISSCWTIDWLTRAMRQLCRTVGPSTCTQSDALTRPLTKTVRNRAVLESGVNRVQAVSCFSFALCGRSGGLTNLSAEQASGDHRMGFDRGRGEAQVRSIA